MTAVYDCCYFHHVKQIVHFGCYWIQDAEPEQTENGAVAYCLEPGTLLEHFDRSGSRLR